MGGKARVIVLGAAVVLAACAPGGGIVSAPNPSSGPTLAEVVIQSGLTVPGDLAVAPDGRLLVTERPGTISMFESTAPKAKRLATVQVAGVRATGEAGLLGLALDPDFTANGLAYVCASRTEQGEWRNQILRYRIQSTHITFDGVVLRAGPVAAAVHSACRLRFGPDRKLWVATGDAGQPSDAQNATSLNGKVLRIGTDGAIPIDNPTLNGGTGPTSVYALGLRNPGGIVFHPDTGACYVLDVGDQVEDEIDFVTPGANFGWPAVLGPGGSARGFVDPAWSSGTMSYALAGATFITGSAWGSWSGSLLVAALKGQDVRRFSVDGATVSARDVLLDRRYGRIRGAATAPDGALLVSTSNGSGDRIIRLVPAR